LSLKNDIEMVKEELTSEEKFFEKAVVTEKFVKKYRNVMIGSVVAVVLFVAGSIAYNASEQNRIDSANAALSELQKNPKDTATLATLSTLSPTLHDVWVYSQAVAKKDSERLKELTDSKAILVSDLASYELALNTNTAEEFDSYANNQDAIYADLAKVQSAVLFMNEKKLDEAHAQLAQISLNSPLSKVAKVLMHYGVK
jgi:hypothetical protein